MEPQKKMTLGPSDFCIEFEVLFIKLSVEHGSVQTSIVFLSHLIMY